MKFSKSISLMKSAGVIFCVMCLFSRATYAAGAEVPDEIESLFKQDAKEKTSEPEETTPRDQALDKMIQDRPAEPNKGGNLKNLSGLATLSPFGDVAILQKKFLPKTGRFEAYGAATGILNDVFFNNFGLQGRMAYYFQERYGIELVGLFLTSAEKDATKDLREKREVITSSLVTPKNFIGLDFKWIPIYGKMSYINSRITPFDLYFSGGLGLTGTNLGTSEPTLHLGTGQTFALSKAMAARWDFTWNFFTSNSTAGDGSKSFFNNLYLTVGMSFFFPEAKYR